MGVAVVPRCGDVVPLLSAGGCAVRLHVFMSLSILSLESSLGNLDSLGLAGGPGICILTDSQEFQSKGSKFMGKHCGSKLNNRSSDPPSQSKEEQIRMP